MIEFVKPTNLNGKELLEELAAGGVAVTGRPNVELEILRLDIKPADKAKATKIIADHNGNTVDVDRSAEKAAVLERLGITAEEAALILG
jgi:hypothetical protein